MRLFGRSKFTSVKVRKKDLPGGLWVKCPECSEIVYTHEIESDHGVCPKCAYHFPITSVERIKLLTEDGSFEEWDDNLISADPIQFNAQVSYVAKIAENRKKSGLKEAVVCGRAKIGTYAVALGVMEFKFLGGSMGSVVGEKVTRLIERAVSRGLPVIIVSASGGARMHEGLFSLMQMAKTSGALARLSEARLPFISVLTNPCTGGVMASFASLGDVIIAEPGALIGFAGPRVIRETTRENIPEGFQRSEFLLKHGLVDMIVHRKDLKASLVTLLGYMLPHEQPQSKSA